ncbi:hypothetical protein F183_A14790 [Bryobacterales bacterium F-183]|nr:hypothetical protein F183_A14790 [Bryobacterales bacterium F-183]
MSRRLPAAVGLLLVLALSARSQNLSASQREADLRRVAGVLWKNYGPYEWKKAVRNFDFYDLQPWLDRARATTDDLEFADLLVDYVASLDDAHDLIYFPSSWTASLGFTTDIYDGKVLIDSINRGRLPSSRFPFQIGDEVVSLDGRPVAEWLSRFRKYSIAANDRSTRRIAAARLTSRTQQVMPIAPRITPDVSTLEIRLAATGNVERYELTWLKNGTPIEFGPVPVPLSAPKSTPAETTGSSLADPLARHHDVALPLERHGVLNQGGRNPIFSLPAGFQRRLGANPSDAFFSGTFEVGGKRLGFIRVPSFSPANTAVALDQFLREMQYFESNTDGLIIDEMRNPGGSVSYCENLTSLLMRQPWKSLGFEVRATSSWMQSYDAAIINGRAAGAANWQIQQLQYVYDVLAEANRQMRGRTGAISLTDGSLDEVGNPNAYTKPIILLVDEMSASGGDAFAAMLQDNRRALLVGMRTMGAGGNVVTYEATAYTEGFVRVTESLMTRSGAVQKVPGLPIETFYVENIGVTPDVEIDYMTRDNLMNAGRPYFNQVMDLAVRYISTGGTPATEKTAR